MKITICGSLAFAKEILDIEEKLKSLGHETVVPLEAKSFVSEITNDRNLNPELGRKGMMGHYHEIAKGDAVLICNFEKNNIPGYIGGATLMEL